MKWTCFNRSSRADNQFFKLFSRQIDFDNIVKFKLLKVIKDVQNIVGEKPQDEYLVKIALKDESTFAYAPRWFAYAERLQIREITDDLLNHDIIKYSSSPYCARVVPVRKKNDTVRLCVDLQPLNDRVVKQKYPFH